MTITELQMAPLLGHRRVAKAAGSDWPTALAALIVAELAYRSRQSCEVTDGLDQWRPRMYTVYNPRAHEWRCMMVGIETDRTHEMIGVGPETFRAIMASWATGLAIVTTRNANGQPRGLTASACCSVSLDPPLLLVCISEHSSSLQAIKESGVFALNILSKDQKYLAIQFSSNLNDRFEDLLYHNGCLGIPILKNVLAYAECTVFRIFPAGDHSIVVGLVLAGGTAEGCPLVYFRRRYGVWAEKPQPDTM